jgi:hypothetical protein
MQNKKLAKIAFSFQTYYTTATQNVAAVLYYNDDNPVNDNAGIQRFPSGTRKKFNKAYTIKYTQRTCC